MQLTQRARSALRLPQLHWSLSTRLRAIFILVILLPIALFISLVATYRNLTIIREQNETRLETLGPLLAVRTEQTLQELTTNLERMLFAPADFESIQDYLQSINSSVEYSAGERNQLEFIAESKTSIFLSTARSLTRIRLLDSRQHLVIDATGDRGRLAVIRNESTGPATPGIQMIEQGTTTGNSTLSDLYLDANGYLSVDVVFTIRPIWDRTGATQPIGYIIFTQNLGAASEDEALPDLFTALQRYPRSEQDTGVYLADNEGQVISAATGRRLEMTITESYAFRQAQRGEARVDSYTSPVTGDDVLGFYQTVFITDGPQITFLVEVTESDITTTALRNTVGPTVVVFSFVVILTSLALTLTRRSFIRPIEQLTQRIQTISGSMHSRHLPRLERRDEIGVLNNSFADLADQFLHAVNRLEWRVAERTRNLETVLEVGRAVTNIRRLDALLEEVVNLIQEQFDVIYHAQVFLVDDRTRRANLHASTGQAGRQLLAHNHYLEVGSQSVIGSVTSSGHAVIALDTSHNPLHKRNEFLPDTRAEMALPLRSGDRVIGALDLQSKLPDAFSQDDVDLFQGMADQIAIAIENARLFAGSHAQIEEIERLNRNLTQSGWRDVERKRLQRRLHASAGLSDSATVWSELQQRAMESGSIAEETTGEHITLAVPVVLRNQVLGAVEWQLPRARYSQEARQMAQELTRRLALAADNIRLFEQSRQAVQREQLVNSITRKLTESTDFEQIMQTAVRELGLALRSSQTAIEIIAPDPDTPTNGSNGSTSQ